MPQKHLKTGVQIVLSVQWKRRFKPQKIQPHVL